MVYAFARRFRHANWHEVVVCNNEVITYGVLAEEDDFDIVFVDNLGNAVQNVPQPVQCTTDSLIKHENDVISGSLAFREEVCYTL
jgi:hypothetical protein